MQSVSEDSFVVSAALSWFFSAFLRLLLILSPSRDPRGHESVKHENCLPKYFWYPASVLLCVFDFDSFSRSLFWRLIDSIFVPLCDCVPVLSAPTFMAESGKGEKREETCIFLSLLEIVCKFLALSCKRVKLILVSLCRSRFCSGNHIKRTSMCVCVCVEQRDGCLRLELAVLLLCSLCFACVCVCVFSDDGGLLF